MRRLFALCGSVVVLGGCGSATANPTHGGAGGGLIAFSAGGRIWVMRPTGAGRRALTPTSLVASQPAWSPTGKEIALAAYSKTGASTGFRRQQISLVSLDGGAPKRVTREAAEIVGMSWAPDGAHLVAAALDASATGVTTGRLVSIDTLSGDETTLVQTDRRDGLDAYPAWSPDGKLIAFTHVDPRTSRLSLWTMNADGSDRRRLANDASDAAWSPTGDRLLFLSTRDHNGQTCGIDECWPNADVYVMHADGTGNTRLTETTQVGESSPTWAPSGTRIAYEHPVDTAGTAIIVAHADGSCPVRVTAVGGDDQTPAWQPGTGDGTGTSVCAPAGQIATSPQASGGPTVSVRQYRSFAGYALWAPGDAFAGLPLTGIYHDKERSRQQPADSVTFLYATCESGGACASQVQVQVWPACLRNLSLYHDRSAYTRTRVRGVPAAAFGSDSDMLEVYTGSVTVVIFGRDAAGRLRVAGALQPVNKVAGSPEPNGDLPPPVPGALEGKLTCS